MSRNKKSRTAGNSEPRFDGSRKETSTQAQVARDKKRKDKLKGNKAGNRNTVETKQGAEQSQRQAKNDKRIGSKKPVVLTVNEKPQQATKPKVVMQPKAKVIKTAAVEPKAPVKEAAPAIQKLSPEKEIEAIENDQRLNDLLEQMETDVAFVGQPIFDLLSLKERLFPFVLTNRLSVGHFQLLQSLFQEIVFEP